MLDTIAFTMIRALLFLVFTLSSVQGSLDSRIVGGNNAWEGKYPYQVLIKYRNFPMCGGSIISNRYILTAAHCIYNKDRYLITITAGTIYSSHNGDTYAAEKLNWPSNYNEIELIHDIGLIRVNENITFNSRVQPIALASKYYVPAGETAVVTGWGRKRSYLPDPAATLQELRVTVILQSECKMYWFLQLKDNNICTLTKKNEGACNGDSGGPLVLNGEQIGIVSYGHPCAEGVPDVYTRVYPYRPWIESVMNDVNHIQLNTWTLLSLTILTLKSYSCSLS